ncbi:Tannase/feruloyl esterase [Ilyonectria sp. MPI-CAGE-AT-0026]|nr:Tannase/feruloyl esterase [Ilyonectria sp. MPI-CAGE-AT-0026]
MRSFFPLSITLLGALASANQLAQMNKALNKVFRHDANTTILHVQHFKPGDYLLSTAPGDGTQPIIPRAKNGVTVVKLFIRTTGDAPAEPDPVTGTDVGIEFWFPDSLFWTGRIINFVDGGFQGSPHVTAPNSSEESSFTSVQFSEWASKYGYVSAVSNGGHITPLTHDANYNGILDTSYLVTADNRYNLEGWKNMAWQGNHLMAIKSKEIAKAYYGRDHNSAYLLGCSSGGRQAYQVAQQFPNDYNGLLVIAPSLHGSQYYTSTGYPTIVVNNDLQDQPFTDTQLEMVSQKAVAHGDTAITGRHDGYITDWQSNTYDPAKDLSVLRVEDGGNCTDSWAISMVQAQALNKIWYGVTKNGYAPDPSVDNGSKLNKSSDLLYWGKLRGIRLKYVIAPATVPSVFLPAAFLNTSLGDPEYFANGTNAWTSSSYQEFAQYIIDGPGIDDKIIQMDAADPDIREFQSLGGKLLVYHGLADQFSPPQHSAAYYEDSASITGGMNATADFHRLFFVPGMDHCSPSSNQAGNANIPFAQSEQFLEKLVTWVEKGDAPEKVIAHSDDNLVSRPICPYPALPKYDGHGNVNFASSFSC